MDRPSLRKQRKPSFFKVLIQDFSSRLQIPPAFIKEFGEEVPKKTILETYYFDKSGEVEVEKFETRFCFSQGWGQFAKDNNLTEGDFLIFKYFPDSSKFKVKIYGRTCCEKQFDGGRERCSNPPLNVKEDKKNLQDGQKRKRDDEEVEDNVKEERDLKFPKRIETEFDGAEAFERDVITIDSNSSSSDGVGGHDDEEELGDSNQRAEKSIRLPIDSQIKFNSENPFFPVKLKYSNLISYLHIPSSFSRKHIRKEHQMNGIKLEIYKKIWNLGLLVIWGPGNKEFITRVTQGWRRFTTENHLKKEDVLIFEMIKNDNELVFRVHVYKWDDQTELYIYPRSLV